MFKRKNKKKKADDSQVLSEDLRDLNDIAKIPDEEDYTAINPPRMEDEDFSSLAFDDNLTPSSLDKGEKANAGKNKGSFLKTFLILLAIVAIAAGSLFYTNRGESSNDSSLNNTSKSEGKGEGKEEEEKGKKDILEGITVNEQIGKSYQGAELGSPVNGTGAIMSFDYYYYVKRDAEKALEFFNPTVKGYDSSFVQENINKVPKGTKYSLEITPAKIGEEYDVVLTLKIPGMEEVKYNQKFSTMNIEGKFYVKNFSSKPKEER